MLLTALKPIATLQTSLEANYDTTRTPHGQSDLWGHELLLCPKITELILQHNFLEVLTLIVQGGGSSSSYETGTPKQIGDYYVILYGPITSLTKLSL